MSRTHVLADGPQHETAASAPVTLSAWQYEASSLVEYEERIILVGGPLLMACTAVLSVLGNRRRRRAAERSAHRWRSLGSVCVVVTGHRLLVSEAHGSSRAGERTVARFHAHYTHACVDVLFADGPPLRLAGPGVEVVVDALKGASRDGGAQPRA